jgi:hypothetical protein
MAPSSAARIQNFERESCFMPSDWTKKMCSSAFPPIQSVLIPIALPELTLYRNLRNRGFTRLSIDLIDVSSGRPVGAAWATQAAVTHERYTVLFLFSWTSTDLLPPPP